MVQNDSQGHTGPNLFQDFPVISSVITSGGTTTIEGTISGAANTIYRIEFFSNETADPSGYGQGQTFLTFMNVTTDGTGTGSFSVMTPSPLSAGLYVSATATDPAGNTSEFSQDMVVALASGSPTYYTVNLTSDTGASSGTDSVTGDPSGDILWAIEQANANANPYGSIINFDPVVFGSAQPITLSSTLELSETAGPEVIDASGVTGPVTISGNHAVRVFLVDSGVVASFTDLTIADGTNGIFSYGTITVTDCTISDNSVGNNVSGGTGGGIWSSGKATVTDSVISGNSAHWGGGIDNLGTMTVTDSMVEDNLAKGGGGIYNQGGMTLTDSTISDNLAVFGGGLWNNAGATLTAENCTFDGDQVSLGTRDRGSNGGGAIYNSGSGHLGPARMYLSDCRFTNNFAKTYGGAISNSTGGIATISGCTFKDNSAGSAGGGGISVLVGALTIIKNSTFVGNTSTGPGGGINVATGSTVTAEDDTFDGNSAASGGAIDNSGRTVTLVNVTIAYNSATTGASGGGLGGAAGTYSLYNTIVAENTAGGAADDIAGTDSFTGEYNLIGVDSTGSFTNGVNGNIVGRAYVGLGVLANNGGPTETIGLLPASPAVFAGSARLRGSRCPRPTSAGWRGRTGWCRSGRMPSRLPRLASLTRSPSRPTRAPARCEPRSRRPTRRWAGLRSSSIFRRAIRDTIRRRTPGRSRWTRRCRP